MPSPFFGCSNLAVDSLRCLRFTIACWIFDVPQSSSYQGCSISWTSSETVLIVLAVPAMSRSTLYCYQYGEC